MTEAAHIPSVLIISDLDKLQVLGFGTKPGLLQTQFLSPSLIYTFGCVVNSS